MERLLLGQGGVIRPLLVVSLSITHERVYVRRQNMDVFWLDRWRHRACSCTFRDSAAALAEFELSLFDTVPCCVMYYGCAVLMHTHISSSYMW